MADDRGLLTDDYPLHDDEYLHIVTQTCTDVLNKIKVPLPELF